MWIHLDLASLQGHWLSLGASGQLVFMKPTKTYQGQSSPQTATTRKTKKQILSRRLPFTFLGERHTHTHTRISQGWLPLYKGHPTKREFPEAILENGSRPPLRNIANIPLQKGSKGAISRGTVEGQTVSLPGSSVSMCKVFVWSFFQERSCWACWAAIFTELWCLQNIFETGSVNLSIYQSIYLTVKTLLFCLTLWWTYNIETGNPQFL